MSIFWATQYRPEDPSAPIAAIGELSEMFAGLGASQTRLLVAMTQDVGTQIVVTNWKSLGDAVAAFDPIDGTALRAIASSKTLSALLAASGTPLRRVIGDIGQRLGDTSTGRYAVNIMQSSAAGSALWTEAGELAWSALKAEGVSGIQLSRVLTGDATGLRLSTAFVENVDQFFGVLSKMPPKLLEIFAATDTSTMVRNVHRIISA